MKKFFCSAGLILSFIVVFTAVGYSVGVITLPTINAENIDKGYDYVNEEVPLIMVRWEKDQLLSRLSQDAYDLNSVKLHGKVDALCKLCRSRLGNLRKLREIQLLNFKNGTSDQGSETTAKYLVYVKFDNGEAEVNVHLKKLSEEWVITYFYISSPEFPTPQVI